MKADTGIAGDLSGTAPTAPLITTDETTEFVISGNSTMVGHKTVEQPSQKMPLYPIDAFFYRPFKMSTHACVTTDTPGLQLVTFDVHTSYFGNTPVTSKAANYAAYRGTFELTVIPNFPAGCYGAYVVYAVPNGGSVDTTNNYEVAAAPTLNAASQLETFAIIDCATCTKVVMTLPFIWNIDYAPLPAGASHMWNFYVVCLTPLTSTSSDATITGSLAVYGHFTEDFEMFIPVQQGKMNLKNMVSEKHAKTASTIKNISSTVASVANSLSAVPVIGSMASVVGTVASGVTSVLDWLGFTRDTAQQTPTPVVQRPYANLANVDAPDTSEISALSVHNGISIDPRIGGGTDEDPASFAHIFSRFTRVQTITWAQSAASGALLGSVYVSPFYTSDATASGVAMTLTTAGYVGLPFQLWRGDMEYLIYIPVSSFHRGTLQVGWSSATGASASDGTNQVANTIIDVQPGCYTHLSVGYSKAEPVCKSMVFSGTYPSILQTDWFNGLLSFTVVNPLTSPIHTLSTTIHIFARAKENMIFGVPKVVETYSPGSGLSNIPFSGSWVPQGLVLGDDEAEDKVIELIPSSGAYPADKILFGEDFRSVRALVQKFSQLSTIQTTANQQTILGKCCLQLNHFGTMGPPLHFYYPAVGTNVIPFSWMAFYKYLFVGVAGSVRYKVVNLYTGSGAPSQTTCISIGAADIHISNLRYAPTYPDPVHVSALWPVAYGNAVEQTVPYYHSRKYILGRSDAYVDTAKPATPNSDDCRIDQITILNHTAYANDATSSSAFIAYQAMGPDVRFTMFRFTPTVFMNTTAPDWKPWLT